MLETLQAIARLQPSYTPENTPEMQERGRLVRTELAGQLRELEPMLAHNLGEFGHHFLVEASDGIGRKTEAPWVRFASRKMSPTPRDGFYSVIHFSADGSAFWVTIGCGSTVWTGGDLRSLPDEELDRRTAWARTVVSRAFHTAQPFSDSISLGAKARLPRTFERATALAKRFAPDISSEHDVLHALQRAAVYLAEIYRAQSTAAHLSPAQLAEMQIEEVSRPNRRLLSRQGIGLTGTERRAVELRAMAVAKEWLEQEGFTVFDRSATASFDFEAIRRNEVIKVEVKGTTGEACDEFIMTRNEVELHKAECGSTALLLVSGIKLVRSSEGCSATGGLCKGTIGWDIGGCHIEPMAYRVRLM